MASDLNPKAMAESEWLRGTVLIWPILALINLIQAYLTVHAFPMWFLALVVALVIASLITWVLYKKRFKYNSVPIIVVLCVAPLLIGDTPTASWTSIGLTIFAATIYFAIIEIFWLAVLINVILVAYQTYLAQLNLNSISDSRDLSYFSGYFSITWTLVIGIGSVLIRRRYIINAKQLNEIIELELQKNAKFYSSLKQVNEKDTKNLKLHGTILNTLIYILKKWVPFEEARKLVQNLEDDVADLRQGSTQRNVVDVRSQLMSALKSAPIKRLKIDIVSKISSAGQKQMNEATIEIIREYLLNLEKHSMATLVQIEIDKKRDGSIVILIDDNSLSKIPKNIRSSEKYQIFQSNTLNKLLKSFTAEMDIARGFNQNKRTVEIKIPKIDVAVESLTLLKKLRLTGLNDLVTNYGWAVLIGSLFALLGYFFTGTKPLPLILITLTTLGFLLSLLTKLQPIILTLATFLSLVIFPSLALPYMGCESTLIFPWVFNLVLGLSFLFLVNIKSKILRWLPLLVFSIQTVLIPRDFDAQCQDIFLGSIPGIPLLIILAFIVIGIRNREIIINTSLEKEISQNTKEMKKIESLNKKKFNFLINDIDFQLKALAEESDELEFYNRINLLVQKIRLYLNLEEFFSSKLVQSLYDLALQRNQMGYPEKWSIFGDDFEKFDSLVSYEDFKKFLEDLSSFTVVSVSIGITSPEAITVEIETEKPAVMEKCNQVGVNFVVRLRSNHL